MKEHALSVFRCPPKRLNCAQSVIDAWKAITRDSTISIADFNRLGGGRAPDGLCGALHAACAIVPAQAGQLRAGFAERLGSLYCKELRAAKQHPCEACVALAAELLEIQTRWAGSENDHR